MESDIIVIGGGAAGLMAAYELVKGGKKVILLEARDRLGGRIHTFINQETGEQMEAGAEFIHGNLPVTFKLLEESNIDRYATEGKSWLFKKGVLKQGDDLIEDWGVLMSRVEKVKEDISISDFFLRHLNEPQFEDLRRSVTSFVEGYDAADITRTSLFAMKAEWQNEDQWDQYRPKGGYGKLVHYLENKSTTNGASIHLNSVVKMVKWRKHDVEVVTADGRAYKASRAIIAVPLGVLQADESVVAGIEFQPAIPDKINAAKEMGYGAVIKILLRFDEAFWNKQTDERGNTMNEMGYLFSQTFIPTWWTQFPKSSTLLTGWLGGPKAAALKDAADEIIVQHALQALSEIFGIPIAALKNMLKEERIFSWATDPFALGAYSYNTMQSASAKKILQQPVDNTIYFTGEALGKNTEAGTVEVALAAGKQTGEEIVRSYEI